MHSAFLIGGQAKDGRSHTYGMSVCRTAKLHHQIHPTVSQEAVGFFFSGAVLRSQCNGCDDFIIPAGLAPYGRPVMNCPELKPSACTQEVTAATVA